MNETGDTVMSADDGSPAPERAPGERRSSPEPADGPDGGDGLTTEDARLLIVELREILKDDPGALEPEEAGDRIRRLLTSLERAPCPERLRDEILAQLRSWSQLWLEKGSSGDAGAADSVRSLLLTELARLEHILLDEG